MVAFGLKRTLDTVATSMITAHQLEVRAGARLLMEGVSFRVAAGDKVGLVGRNGAGKTTLTKILAGEGLPASGTVHSTGTVGYLPQDPRTGDPTVLARERILSARGLDDVVRRLRASEIEMGSDDVEVRDKAMRRYERADAELHAGGGYAAEAEAAQIAASLGIEDRILTQPLSTLSGGQRRRVELARILFSGADSMLLDEPTNHLDADSIVWLRDYLASYKGGLIVISHDTALLETTVNRVLHLDANRAEIDVYNMGWKAYLQQRETDEKRRKRERMNAENKAKTLTDQANRMRAKATKAQAAQSMLKRAERLMAGLEGERQADKIARIEFPAPAPCGKTPLMAAELSKSYGSLEIFTDVNLAIDKGSRVVILGLNGAGKTTLLRILAGVDQSDTGKVLPGPRPEDRLLRPGARDPRHRAARCWRTCRAPRRSSPTPRRARCSARSSSPATTPTSPPGCSPAGRRRDWRSRRSWSRAPTSCCSTSPPTTSTRPPARRCWRRSAPTRARSSWSPTTRVPCSPWSPSGC